MTGISQSDQKKQLDTLFKDLKTIGSRAAAMEIEQKIWDIWVTHPSDRKLTEMLSKGSGYMSQNRLGDAYIVFTEVIALDDKWAEAWNKRATVLYLLGDYQSSQNDIDKVLKLEDRHFGALAGQGLVNIKLENYEKAIKSYEKAQEIYPAMQSPKIMIEQIEQLIKQQLI